MRPGGTPVQVFGPVPPVGSLAEGVYAYSATQTWGGVTSNRSTPWFVTVDRTAPTVTLTADSSTKCRPGSTASSSPYRRAGTGAKQSAADKTLRRIVRIGARGKAQNHS